jgi:hypothetical protein
VQNEREGHIYQMYSAIILSVNGVVSKLSNPSNLETVPLSALTANTLNIEEFFFAFDLCELSKSEFNIRLLLLKLRLVLIVLLLVPSWHCIVGTSVCAILLA